MCSRIDWMTGVRIWSFKYQFNYQPTASSTTHTSALNVVYSTGLMDTSDSRQWYKDIAPVFGHLTLSRAQSYSEIKNATLFHRSIAHPKTQVVITQSDCHQRTLKASKLSQLYMLQFIVNSIWSELNRIHQIHWTNKLTPITGNQLLNCTMRH